MADNEQQPQPTRQGEESYEQWRKQLRANPEYERIYQEEAAKSALWLQLVEARQRAGLSQTEVARRMGVSQAQVARIEKAGYDAYTLNTLRRYVASSAVGQVRHAKSPDVIGESDEPVLFGLLPVILLVHQRFEVAS